MPSITILRGLPGSGKSSYAEQLLASNANLVRVNKDDLRSMIHRGQKWSGKRESTIVELQMCMVSYALSVGKDVVIDDTNFNPSHINRYTELANKMSYDISVISINTPVNECIARDAKREGKARVNKDVILSMAYQNGLLNDHPEYAIFDLDGTLADISERRKVSDLGNGKINWDKFYDPENVWLDVPRRDVFDMMMDAKTKGLAIVICSGRSDVTRANSETWLKNAYVKYYGADANPEFWYRFIMRQDGDNTPDDKLKLRWITSLLPKDKCKYIVDDRPRVIRMWQALGLSVIDVGDGIEF